MNHPVRMCVSCKERKMQSCFIRLQHLSHGYVGVVQHGQGSQHLGPGRSAYVCPNESCMRQAIQRGAILRSLFRGKKTHTRLDEAQLWAAVSGGL